MAKFREKARSPSYPSTDLRSAMESLRELYQHSSSSWVSLLDALGSWGYSSLSGPAGMHLAALKQFGLLDVAGSRDDRRVRVSDRGLRILESSDSDLRSSQLRDAAIAPAIHRVLWEAFGPDIPAQADLAIWLTERRHFTQTGASILAAEYRATAEYAGLANAPYRYRVDEVDTRVQGPDLHGSIDSSAGLTRQPLEYTVPVDGGVQVLIRSTSEMSPAQWQQFVNALPVLRPGFVRDPSPVSQDCAS